MYRVFLMKELTRRRFVASSFAKYECMRFLCVGCLERWSIW